MFGRSVIYVEDIVSIFLKKIFFDSKMNIFSLLLLIRNKKKFQVTTCFQMQKIQALWFLAVIVSAQDISCIDKSTETECIEFVESCAFCLDTGRCMEYDSCSNKTSHPCQTFVPSRTTCPQLSEQQDQVSVALSALLASVLMTILICFLVHKCECGRKHFEKCVNQMVCCTWILLYIGLVVFFDFMNHIGQEWVMDIGYWIVVVFILGGLAILAIAMMYELIRCIIGMIFTGNDNYNVISV